MSDSSSPEGGPNINRRTFIKLAAGATGITALGSALARLIPHQEQPKQPPQQTEITPTPENPNLVKAQELLREVGIEGQFATTSPRKMYEANQQLSAAPDFDTKIWKIFTDTKGLRLGLAIAPDGEPIPLRDGPDNKPQRIPGLDSEFRDIEKPQLIYTYKLENEDFSPAFGIVGYSDAEKLKSILKSDPEATNELLQVIFAHTAAPVNFLHIGQGMPTQVFNPFDEQEKDYLITQEDLPSPRNSGTSFIKYEADTHNIHRADIYISNAHIQHDARILAFQPKSVLAGMLANEAHGNAIHTHRIVNNLEQQTGMYEIGSTGADWATRHQVAHNSPNAFFPPKVMNLIEQIAALQ